MENSASQFPTLEAGVTEIDFFAGYKIYDSATSGVNVNLNARSNQLTIKVADSAMTLAASAVLAATTMLAF